MERLLDLGFKRCVEGYRNKSRVYVAQSCESIIDGYGVSYTYENEFYVYSFDTDDEVIYHFTGDMDEVMNYLTEESVAI